MTIHYFSVKITRISIRNVLSILAFGYLKNSYKKFYIVVIRINNTIKTTTLARRKINFLEN